MSSFSKSYNLWTGAGEVFESGRRYRAPNLRPLKYRSVANETSPPFRSTSNRKTHVWVLNASVDVHSHESV